MDKEMYQKLNRILEVPFSDITSYIDLISYLILLKFLDEAEEESIREPDSQFNIGGKSSLFPDQAERFRWSRWCSKEIGDVRDILRDEIFPYMSSLDKESPQIASYFHGATLEDIEFKDLSLLIDELGSINFHKLAPNISGELYEYILEQFNRRLSEEMLQTPRHVRAFMVEMVDPNLGETIFNPACRTGEFLIESLNYLLAKYSDNPLEIPIYGEDWLDKRGQKIEEVKKEFPDIQTYSRGPGEKISDWRVLQNSIHGTDVSRKMTRIAFMNLMMHGINNPGIKRANVLSDKEGLSGNDLDSSYDIILCSVPIEGVLPRDGVRHNLSTRSTKSELLFLELMMKHLAPKGRCAVIVPEQMLDRLSSAHKELRKKLVSDFKVLAVISLPADVFKPSDRSKKAVLIFQRPSKSTENGPATSKIWFYEINNDGFRRDKTQDELRVEKPEENDIPGLLEAWAKYRASDFQEVPGPAAYKVLYYYTPEPVCWWTDFETIKESDFNLRGARYKPRVFEKGIPYKDPAELVKQILEIERESTSRLEKLLDSLEAN